jgi:hypothetical protein
MRLFDTKIGKLAEPRRLGTTRPSFHDSGVIRLRAWWSDQRVFEHFSGAPGVALEASLVATNAHAKPRGTVLPGACPDQSPMVGSLCPEIRTAAESGRNGFRLTVAAGSGSISESRSLGYCPA